MLQKTWFQQIHDDTLLIPGAKLFPATMVLGILLACCLVVIIILLLTRNKNQVCEHCKGLYFLNNWFCGAFDFIERSYFRNHSSYSLALILISIFIINFYNRVTSILHELLNLKVNVFLPFLFPGTLGASYSVPHDSVNQEPQVQLFQHVAFSWY